MRWRDGPPILSLTDPAFVNHPGSETEKNSKSLAPRTGATRIGEAVRSIFFSASQRYRSASSARKVVAAVSSALTNSR